MGNKSPEERFWEKTGGGLAEECWLWTGALSGGRYGSFWDGTRYVKAHRWAYEHLVGPIPGGLQLDHLCRVTRCVNPAHLEPVTNRENTLRGVAPGGDRPRSTGYCHRGHLLTPGARQMICLVCIRERKRSGSCADCGAAVQRKSRRCHSCEASARRVEGRGRWAEPL